MTTTTYFAEHVIWQRMRSLRHQANQQGVVIPLRQLHEIAIESLRNDNR